MRAYIIFLSLLFVTNAIAAQIQGADPQSFQSNLHLRQSKRVGIGASLNGMTAATINLELNIEDQDGVVAGFGSGVGYNSFQLLWKHNFEGQYLSPYTTLGVSHWYSSTTAATIRKNYVLNSALTTQQKESGRYDVDFLAAALGAQYNQLSGEMVGASFYGEIQLLESIEKPSLSPAGAIGAIYYF